MKKLKSKIVIAAVCCMIVTMFSSCAKVSLDFSKIDEALRGKSASIHTYDTDSNIIDSIHGTSISLEADDKFQISDGDGNVVEKSPVLKITVGGEPMSHVGSSMILYEDGLKNVFESYAKKVDIDNIDRSTPFINNMVNDMKNDFTGISRIILIRSQSGKPLATFVGNKVSLFATDSDKTTCLMVDGKYMLIYRCDYTIYSKNLLK